MALGGDNVHEGAALGLGKDGPVHVPGELRSGEDEGAPGAAQGLVGGGGDDVGVGQGRGMGTAGNEAGNMSHVHHQGGADLVGDGP